MTDYQTDLDYQNHILNGVSRTFALTIPQLPPRLYSVVGNAYLLCRIADTIEDEPSLSLETKQQFAQQFIQVVAGQQSSAEFAATLTPRLSDEILPAERELVSRTETVIRLTHSYSEAQQASLLRCVRIMMEGMSRFQQGCNRSGLPDMPALDQYCYYVAGVVGEMLTELFSEYSSEIAANHDELYRLSTSFGQGLQMTNILKDIWDDWERGVCWLPQSVFAEKGFTLTSLRPQQFDPAFGEGLVELIGVAHHHLHNALRYVLLIPAHETGIRRFCLWALGMAMLTLRRISQKLDFYCGQQVKISRRSVRATILISNLSASHDSWLKLIFALLARGLPAERVLSTAS